MIEKRREGGEWPISIVDETLLAAFLKKFPIEPNKPIFVLRKRRNSLCKCWLRIGLVP